MAEKTKPPSKRSIYFGDPIAHLLKTQGDDNVSRTLNAAINRYLKICHHHRPDLSIEEWSLIASAVKRAGLREDSDPRSVLLVVEDHLRTIHVLEEPTGQRLMDRIKTLPLAGLCAVLHYTEIYLSSGLPVDTPAEIAWERAFQVSSRILKPVFEKLEQGDCPHCGRKALHLHCHQDDGEFSADPKLAMEGVGPMWVAPYYGKYRHPVRTEPWLAQCQNPVCRGGGRGIPLSELAFLTEEDCSLLAHYH